MKKLLSYLKDTKGSGIVTVMLSILFLTAFGTLALYTTYTSVETVASERGGFEAEMNANTCMDEIRAGVQQVVSEAITETYNEVMPNYTKSNANITESFREMFSQKILTSKYIFEDDDPVDLFTRSGHNGETITYKKDTLEKMVRERRGYECTVDSPTGFKAIISPEGDSITLKDIKVTYRFDTGRYKNRSSTVTTDIIIQYPDFGYLLTQYSIKGLPSFAIVAKDIIQNTDTTVEMNGSVYAENITLGNASNAHMTVKNYSTLVVKDNINVNGGPTAPDKILNDPRFKVDYTSTLWAGNIDVGSNSSTNLEGNIYVANDLVFSGNNAHVTLGITEKEAGKSPFNENPNPHSGYYTGFGYSDSDPAKSSSIIANNKNNILDVSHLGSLTLAGYSFISNKGDRYIINGESAAPALRTGESLSGKRNQLAYYAPKGTVVKNTLVFDEYGFPINKDGTRMERSQNGSWKFYTFDSETGDKIYVEGVVFDPKIESVKISPNEDDNPKPGVPEFTLISEAELTDFRVRHGYFSLDGEEVEVDPQTLEIRLKNYSTKLTWGDKTYAYYTASVNPILERSGNDWTINFFLNFDSPEKTNEYFAAYYNSDPADFQSNFLNYLQPHGLNAGLAKVASGSFYKDDNYTYAQTTESGVIERLKEEAAFLTEIFENLCKTLSNVKFEDETADNPFDVYVYGDKIDEMDPGTELEFKVKDKTVAIVTNKANLTIDNGAKYKDVCLVISTGNITITKTQFTGLILTSGDLTIGGSTGTYRFLQSEEDIIKAFSATCGDMILKDFFRKNITKDYTVGDDFKISPYGKAYDVSTMVYYKNWRE